MRPAFLAILALAVATSAAKADITGSVFVPATADPWLAGQTSIPASDFPDSFGNYGADGAGTLPIAISPVSAGELLSIQATGSATLDVNNPVPASDSSSPNGITGATANITGYGRISGYSGVRFPLVGVFDGSDPSSWTILPVGGSSSRVVPAGATTFYLGVADAFNSAGHPGAYDDNGGGFQVAYDIASIPEPATGSVLLLGAIASIVVKRRRGSALG